MHALQGVSVDFPAGQFTAIMGPSGSGKSTLMHLLAGLDRPTSGSVVVDGLELANLDDKRLTDLRRDKLGFVFQAFNLIPVLSARENILLPLMLAGKKAEDGWLDTLVDAVGLRDRLTHRPVRALRRPAAARGDRPRARSPARRSSSPTSRRATSTRSPRRRSSASCAARSTSSARR